MLDRRLLCGLPLRSHWILEGCESVIHWSLEGCSKPRILFRGTANVLSWGIIKLCPHKKTGHIIRRNPSHFNQKLQFRNSAPQTATLKGETQEGTLTEAWKKMYICHTEKLVIDELYVKLNTHKNKDALDYRNQRSRTYLTVNKIMGGVK